MILAQLKKEKRSQTGRENHVLNGGENSHSACPMYLASQYTTYVAAFPDILYHYELCSSIWLQNFSFSVICIAPGNARMWDLSGCGSEFEVQMVDIIEYVGLLMPAMLIFLADLCQVASSPGQSLFHSDPVRLELIIASCPCRTHVHLFGRPQLHHRKGHSCRLHDLAELP